MKSVAGLPDRWRVSFVKLRFLTLFLSFSISLSLSLSPRTLKYTIQYALTRYNNFSPKKTSSFSISPISSFFFRKRQKWAPHLSFLVRREGRMRPSKTKLRSSCAKFIIFSLSLFFFGPTPMPRGKPTPNASTGETKCRALVKRCFVCLFLFLRKIIGKSFSLNPFVLCTSRADVKCSSFVICFFILD